MVAGIFVPDKVYRPVGLTFKIDAGGRLSKASDADAKLLHTVSKANKASPHSISWHKTVRYGHIPHSCNKFLHQAFHHVDKQFGCYEKTMACSDADGYSELLMPIAMANEDVQAVWPKVDISMQVSEARATFQPIVNRGGQITGFVIVLYGNGLCWMLPKVSCVTTWLQTSGHLIVVLLMSTTDTSVSSQPACHCYHASVGASVFIADVNGLLHSWRSTGRCGRPTALHKLCTATSPSSI